MYPIESEELSNFRNHAIQFFYDFSECVFTREEMRSYLINYAGGWFHEMPEISFIGVYNTIESIIDKYM